MAQVNISSGATTVGDLTVDEFQKLVREVVVQTLSDMLGDPDEGLALREDFIEELQHSLATVEAGGKTIPVEKVAEKLGISLSEKHNSTQLCDEEFDALADQLANEFMACVGPDCPPLSDCTISREGLYEDHL